MISKRRQNMKDADTLTSIEELTTPRHKLKVGPDQKPIHRF